MNNLEEVMNYDNKDVIRLIKSFKKKYLRKYQSPVTNGHNFFNLLVQVAEMRGIYIRYVLIEKYC